MKLALSLLILSLTSFADTYEYEIKGMHCGACKKAISSTVCKLPGIKTCDINIGSMTLTAEQGKTLDQAAIKGAVDEAAKKYMGEYAISSSKEIKHATNSDQKSKKKE